MYLLGLNMKNYILILIPVMLIGCGDIQPASINTPSGKPDISIKNMEVKEFLDITYDFLERQKKETHEGIIYFEVREETENYALAAVTLEPFNKSSYSRAIVYFTSRRVGEYLSIIADIHLYKLQSYKHVFLRDASKTTLGEKLQNSFNRIKIDWDAGIRPQYSYQRPATAISNKKFDATSTYNSFQSEQKANKAITNERAYIDEAQLPIIVSSNPQYPALAQFTH